MTEPVFRIRAGGTEATRYQIARRPETPEDALAVLQAFFDVGDVRFYARDDDQRAKLDANPMLERAEREQPRRWS